MAKKEVAKYNNFYILNVKLRKRTSQVDLEPKDYVRIFKKVFKEKVHKESSPNKHCIFKFMFEEKDNNDTIKYLSGTFAQFTFIQNDRWFNLDNLDFDHEFNIPEGLFPDAVVTNFVFIPSAHRFCFKVSSNINLSPYPIKNFLELALDQVCTSEEYLQVDVESDLSSVEAILNARELRKLVIEINYSNMDIGDDFKMFVEEDIRASNSKRLKIEATQKPNLSIDVSNSKILSGALEACISNGEAEAKILDENNKVKTIKTSNYPRKENVFSTASRFNEAVFEKIISIFRPNGN